MLARNETIIKWLLYTAAALACFVIQGTVLQRISIWGVIPFVYPAVAAIPATYEGTVPGTAFAVGVGVACDLLLPASSPCFYTLVFPLVGLCAALFPMPVIGIPMKTSDLGGVDSLYSIVQMPSGIPVATVAINGGKNAGILAAKILATSDPELLAKLKAYSEEMKNEVVGKDEKLQKLGHKEYLAQK